MRNKQLVRKNVLLFNWHYEEIRKHSHKFNISTSEIIRIDCCLFMIGLIAEKYKDFKPNITYKQLYKFIIESENFNKIDHIKLHELIHKIHAECYRAIQFCHGKSYIE